MKAWWAGDVYQAPNLSVPGAGNGLRLAVCEVRGAGNRGNSAMVCTDGMNDDET